ncbi:MAG: hypothetical protein GWN71_36800, partial [Gammaproteobacteria bacterium]|nr:hypothetical protein [Gammaproteobacteria bacterium]
AISLLESARSDLSGVAAADLSGFNSRVKGDGLDLANTIDAMLARFYLFAGQYQDAADAADRVDPTVLSVFDYASPDINPVHDLSFRAEYVAGLQTWANDAEGGDDRVDFWLNTAVAPQPNTDSLLYEFAQYTA